MSSARRRAKRRGVITMYLGFPPLTHLAVRATLALSWILMTGAGVAAVSNSSKSIEEILGGWVYAIGGALAVFGVFATYGAWTEKYQWEWVATWGVAASLAPYAVISWLVGADSGHFASAFLFSAAIGLVIARGLFCSGHAARLRAIHLALTRVADRVDDDSEG